MLLSLIIVKKLRKQWFFAGLICAAAFGVFVLFAPAEWFSFIKIGAVQYHIKQIELIPMFAHKDVILKKCIVAVMILYTFVMTSKNIYSYINQNNYEGCNIIM